MPRTDSRNRRALLSWLAIAACLLFPRCHMEWVEGVDGTAPEERYVAVRLHDSLSRYDSVEVLILSAADTAQLVGRLWAGPLSDPSALPDFRLQEGESRTLAVRVQAWDADGRLVLDQLITKVDGKQVVTALPIPDPTKPGPSTRLAALSISPGTLAPDFDPAHNDYTASLTYEQSSIVVTAVPATDTAEMRVEGMKVAAATPSDPVELLVGENEISVRVTVGDSERLYSIQAIRAPRVVPQDTTKPDTVNPPLKGWKYKASVDVNVYSLGMGPGTGVKDFPLLVRLDKDNFNFSQAVSDGRDVRFARLGKLLDHEITRWDTAAEEADVWVRIDTIRGDTAFTPLDMYWGNPFATSTSDAAKVFPASAGHNAVWHLSESGRGAADEYKDATGRFHGVGVGSGSGSSYRRAPRRTDGVVGYGQNFSSGGGGQAATIDLPRAFDPGETWTLQGWIRVDGTTTGVIFYKGDAWAANNQRFGFDVTAATGGAKLALHREGDKYETNIFPPRGHYVHVSVLYDGIKASFYVDGSPRESIGAWTQGTNGGGVAMIGASASGGGANPFVGSVDELWFSSVVRSPSWIRLTYENQRAGSYLVVVNPAVILPGAGGLIPDIPGLLDGILK